jgi:hypothetical protein
MFVHHVFFWLRPGADRQQLIEGLRVLAKLDLIKQAHIGIPADTHRDVVERSYGVSWLLHFDSAADQDVYQDHAMHHKFIADCKHLWEKVVVYDSVKA